MDVLDHCGSLLGCVENGIHRYQSAWCRSDGGDMAGARIYRSYSTDADIRRFLCRLFFSQHALWSEVWRVLPPALVGIFLGFLCFGLVPSASFAPVIGWIVLVLVLLQLAQRSLGNGRFAGILSLTEINGNSEEAAKHPTFVRRIIAILLGALSGVTTMLANAAGPVMTVYLLAVGLDKYEFVGTIAWIFCIINLFKLPFSYTLGVINWHTLGFNLLLLPAVTLGALSGQQLLKLIPQLWFERFLLLSALLASLRLIWH
jgi:uncharacterized membrane protein YfcA